MAKRFSLIIGFIVLLVSCLGLPGCAPSPIELIFDENPKIAAGSCYSLAIDGEGNIWSWGVNSEGELGTGDREDRNIPVQITEGISYKAVAAGRHDESYAIDEDGNLWSWGGFVGRVGQEKIYQTTPIKVIEEKKFLSVSVGQYHALAIDSEGNLWGWGDNTYGALGHVPWSISDGYYPDSIFSPTEFISISTPVPILQGKKVKQVSAGDHLFSFAIDEDGGLWRWGRMSATGPEGGPLIFSHPTPKKIMPEVRFKQVSAGYTSALAIDEEGYLWACGGNRFGTLGDGTTIDRMSFVRVKSNRRFVWIKPDLFRSYAIDEEGQLWGFGKSGSTVPEREMEGMQVTQVVQGIAHKVLLAADGTVWARGGNYLGQLGDGTYEHSSEFIPVFKR